MTKSSFILFLFIPLLATAQDSSADCAGALVICQKTPVYIEELPGPGWNTGEINRSDCYADAFPESNSVWLKWTVQQAGSLTFTILPFDENDDVDFILYQLPGGLSDCTTKNELRCMAAGKTLGGETAYKQGCTGATGLSEAASTLDQRRGCPEGSTNFLSAPDVEAGESYALFINNFRSSAGVVVDFGGTCTFLPVAGRCDAATPADPVASDQGPTDAIRVSDAFPNPSSGQVFLEVATTRAEAGSWQIIALDGAIRASQEVALPAGTSMLELDTHDLNAGTYFIKLKLGTSTHLARFVR